MTSAPSRTLISARGVARLGLLALALWATGCRPSVDALGWQIAEARQPARITLTPVYAIESFGMTPAAHGETLRAAEAALIVALRARGAEVLPSDALHEHMRAKGVERELERGVLLTRELSGAFEAGRSRQGDEAIEVVTLTSLHARGLWPPGALLVAQLLYHTEGICPEQDPRRRAPNARLITLPGAPKGRALCVVDHLHLKLVSPATGETLWQGQGFAEVRASRHSEATRHMAMRAAALLALDRPEPLLRPQAGARR